MSSGELYVLDIEADNLYDLAEKVHVVVLYNPRTGTQHTFRPSKLDEDDLHLATHIYYDLGERAPTIVGHNILGYDLPVLRKLFGIQYTVGKEDTWNGSRVTFIDTWQLSSFLWPDRPGGHSLDNLARLAGSYKQGYTGGWTEWNQEMEDYCIQDCKATYEVYKYLMRELKEKYGDYDS